ncbi:unnamed protein product [Menidia menidia]|uniref:(Atlantic silverside) hypothetical protein n=1 Tax=Menidia menidia TaxID=238744 RepID=A0A8S4A827_9TELE|nr:unnamed protein product [Menidia menidia]
MLLMNDDQLNGVIQSWRDTKEEDLKPEDYQQFKNFGSFCLTEGDSQQLLAFLRDDSNQDIVRYMGCVLLDPLVNEVVKRKKNHDDCQAAITHLTMTCSPENVLHCWLKILADIDPGAISEIIIAILPHLQTVLFKLDERKAVSVGLALSALQKQLSRLPVPYTEQQEEDDELGLCRCCTALALFMEPFVEEAKKKDDPCVGEDDLKIELLKFCMKSLRDPLLEADLNRERQSALWLFAVEITAILHAIRESLSELIFFSSLRKSTLMDTSVFKESRACLAYLLFVQLLAMDSFPAVFSPVFILQCNMEHISQLLSSKKESHLLKGLALLEKSLEKVEDDCLPVGLLEQKSFHSSLQNLQCILTDCPMLHLRKSGLKILQLFINKLDLEARHKFFRYMLKTSHHAGLESYIVNNIRGQVELSMKQGNANKWFLGNELISLLELVLRLPECAETDLLTNMDRIMESLNLLRYMFLRDKELRRNTFVWDELIRIKDEYLKLLRVCISMSRAYYSAELKALREDQRLQAKEARDAARSNRLIKSMTVKPEKMANMPPEVQHQVLQIALVTFDLMESLIIRIEEIAEKK